MKHLRWQALITILGLALTVGLLVGQRTDKQPRPPEEVRSSGAYTEALIGAPRALNPLLDALNPVDRDLDRLIFSGLIRFDNFGRPMPDVAADWSISADQTTYTFILKPSVLWHDGAPLTADDVAFTVRLMQDPNYPGPEDLKKLWRTVTVAVTGTQTIAFTLSEPFAPFLDYTSFGILPRHVLENTNAGQLPHSPFNVQPIGSGPYQFDRWLATGEQVTGMSLKAFPGFYDQRVDPDTGQPVAEGDTTAKWKLTQLTFKFYPDAASALEALKKGDVMGVSRIDREHAKTALQIPDLNFYTTLRPEYSLIFLNQRDETLPFFKEKKVRQALLLGLNRSAMVTDILNGQAVVANSPVIPGSWAHNMALPTANYDPQAAIALLEGAGWTFPEGALPGTETYVRQKKGVPLKFTLTVPDTPVHLAVARAAQSTWAPLGVQVEISPEDPVTIRGQFLEPRAFQAILIDLSLAGTPDPDPYPLWHETQAESGQNYSGFVDRISSQYLEQARITTDLAERARLYQSFQSRFADQVPALLLYYPTYNYAVKADIGGVQVGTLTEPSDRFNTVAEWYLVKRSAVQPLAGEGATPNP
jgi:peptide/nickel transport system substrate-binding protein